MRRVHLAIDNGKIPVHKITCEVSKCNFARIRHACEHRFAVERAAERDAVQTADQFTVDFDDRGVAGDPMDGTDWGNDLGMEKCADGPGETWYILVREL